MSNSNTKIIASCPTRNSFQNEPRLTQSDRAQHEKFTEQRSTGRTKSRAALVTGCFRANQASNQQRDPSQSTCRVLISLGRCDHNGQRGLLSFKKNRKDLMVIAFIFRKGYRSGAIRRYVQQKTNKTLFAVATVYC
jgi:hypothetical protein